MHIYMDKYAAASQPNASLETQQAAAAELGRNIWLSAAIEIANKKGPNYRAMQEELAAQPNTVTVYQGQEGGSGGGSYWSTNLERAKSFGKNVSSSKRNLFIF